MPAGEHLVAVRLDLGLAREREQRAQDRRGDQVFGVVEQDLDIGRGCGVVLCGEGGESVGILREEVFEYEVGALGCVDGLQRLPGGVVCYRV